MTNLIIRFPKRILVMGRHKSPSLQPAAKLFLFLAMSAASLILTLNPLRKALPETPAQKSKDPIAQHTAKGTVP